MAERGVSHPGVPEQTLALAPRTKRCHQRVNEDLLGPKGQKGKEWGLEGTTKSLWREGCPRFLRGLFLRGQRRGAWNRIPELWAAREGNLGPASSTRTACRRCAEGGAGSYLLCASSTAEPEAGRCVLCGSRWRSPTAAQSTAPAPAPARPGRSTPRQGEGRWARGSGWAGRPLKLGAPGSGRASAPS